MKQRLLNSFPVRVLKRYGAASGGTWATAISWNALFGFFPIILAITTLLGLVGGSDIGGSLDRNMGQQGKLIIQALQSFHHAAGLLLIVSFVGLLWSGSSLFGAMDLGLDALYPIKQRSFVREKLMAAAVTLPPWEEHVRAATLQQFHANEEPKVVKAWRCCAHGGGGASRELAGPGAVGLVSAAVQHDVSDPMSGGVVLWWVWLVTLRRLELLWSGIAVRRFRHAGAGSDLSTVPVSHRSAKLRSVRAAECHLTPSVSRAQRGMQLSSGARWPPDTAAASAFVAQPTVCSDVLARTWRCQTDWFQGPVGTGRP